MENAYQQLIAFLDPTLLGNDEIYFNVARLDRSMVRKVSDYVRLAKPRMERIAEVRNVAAS